MSLPPPPPPRAPVPIVPLAYADTAVATSRPGVLIAVGVVALIVGVIALFVNGAGIVASVGLYAMTRPVLPVPSVVATPMVPAKPLTPYHGDYLPPTGMPAPGRAAVVAAVAGMTSLSVDRREMLDRLLAEAGRSAFGTDPADPAAARVLITAAGQDPIGPDGPGTLGTQFFATRAGRITIDDAVATFRPADGSAPTTVNGDCVITSAGRTLTAVYIDGVVDRVQQGAHGQLNALQGAGLADDLRAVTPPAGRWDSLRFRYGRQAAPGVGTVELDRVGGNQLWILTTGFVLNNPSTTFNDPRTGLPPARPMAPPRALPKPLPIDPGLIIASDVEYALSAGLAIVLFVAGLRLLMDRADAPRLLGIYAVAKPFLTVVNCALFVQVAQQMVDGGLSPGVNWLLPPIILGEQSALAIALMVAFNSTAVRNHYVARRWDGGLVPRPWLTLAARLSPGRWGRRLAGVALALGLLIMAADGYRLSLAHGAQLARSYSFGPTVLTGLVLTLAGAVALVRRPAALAALVVLIVTVAARADGPTADDGKSAAQLVADIRTAYTHLRGPAFQKAMARPDGFVAMLNVLANDEDEYNRLLAGSCLTQYLLLHPRPATPDVQRATDAAIAAIVPRLHDGKAADNEAEQLLHLADSTTIIRLVKPWIAEDGERLREKALGLIAESKPEAVEKWDVIVAAVADPRTTRFASQLLGQCKPPDREARLNALATDHPSAKVRALALQLQRVDRETAASEYRPPSQAARKPAALTAAKRALKDPDAQVRGEAANQLVQTGPDGELQMAAHLRSPDLTLRQTAADALDTDPRTDKVFAAVTPMLHDPNPNVRAAAVAALHGIKSDRRFAPLVTDLLSLLEDPDAEVRFQAGATIGRQSALSRALGPHTYAAYLAARKQDPAGERGSHPRLRPSRPVAVTVAAVLPPEATYTDADPVTGNAISHAPATPVPAPPLLPVIAFWVAALAWPTLVVLVLGCIAGRLVARDHGESGVAHGGTP